MKPSKRGLVHKGYIHPLTVTNFEIYLNKFMQNNNLIKAKDIFNLRFSRVWLSRYTNL